MKNHVMDEWSEVNQHYLMAAVALIQCALEQYLVHLQGDTEDHEPQFTALQQACVDAERRLTAPANLMRLCQAFKLSAFERDIVVLCAGMELDSHFAMLCRRIQSYGLQHADEVTRTVLQSTDGIAPTFSLAFSVFSHAHWSAITPTAPLRYWQLLTVKPCDLLTLSPLSIDEHVLHYLTGIAYVDAEIVHLVTALPAVDFEELVPSQKALAQRMVTAWSLRADESRGRQVVIELCGEDASGKYMVAAAACHILGFHLKRILSSAVPIEQKELLVFMRRWERQAMLNNDVLLLDCHELEVADVVRRVAIIQIIQRISTPLMIVSREHLVFAQSERPVLSLAVPKPTFSEQGSLWRRQVGAENDCNTCIDRLVAQFHLSTTAIQAIVADSMDEARGPDELADVLWEQCRLQARPALDELAQRIDVQAGWHDLVLPENQRSLLEEIVAQVQHRTTVYETWNFRSGSMHSSGISVLFAGPSGTGKTLAAEVIAQALRLDLYRVDLSSVVSKYIGETEKNLRRIFDAAEEGGAILLFDEADALFGKRGEVKDSHDRYANIEVSYLLQRMEAYRGLAILTTNFKYALDNAFLRRLRFIVHFPFPDVGQRRAIWGSIFPASLPLEGIDMDKLARLNIAGGTIRNIALNAAFLAARDGEALQMKHLLQATRVEYSKIEKPLTDAEIEGWVVRSVQRQAERVQSHA